MSYQIAPFCLHVSTHFPTFLLCSFLLFVTVRTQANDRCFRFTDCHHCGLVEAAGAVSRVPALCGPDAAGTGHFHVLVGGLHVQRRQQKRQWRGPESAEQRYGQRAIKRLIYVEKTEKRIVLKVLMKKKNECFKCFKCFKWIFFFWEIQVFFILSFLLFCFYYCFFRLNFLQKIVFLLKKQKKKKWKKLKNSIFTIIFFVVFFFFFFGFFVFKSNMNRFFFYFFYFFRFFSIFN